MKFVLITDYFVEEILGGGELNDSCLCDLLEKRKHDVIKIKSQNVNLDFIKNNKDCFFVVSNFVQLSKDSKAELQKSKYIIYEHDHKYLRNRDPSQYKDYTAPRSALVNMAFYRAAVAVICQSKYHAEIVYKNTKLNNIKNIGGNLWSDNVLDLMEELLATKKRSCFSIVDSPIPHKNTNGAVHYCQKRQEEHELISGDYHSFLKQMAANDKLAFFPMTPETLCRVVVEARMLGVEVHTNSRVGATSEDWFRLGGKELISLMRRKRGEIVDTIIDIFQNGIQHRSDSQEISNITVILNSYRRPYNLKMQIDAIRCQTRQPAQIWLWVNDHEDNRGYDYSNLGLDRVFNNDYNWKFYGRFAAALLADTEYVAIFDDDTVPGPKWFENCLETMQEKEGILGSAGVLLNDKAYVNHERCGWPTQNRETTEVDLVGHAWFFKREWLQYLWREKPPTWDNAEDIQFSYAAQKYGGIKTYCPPHPPEDIDMHGSILGNELGIDKKATSTNSAISHQQFFSERDYCVQSALKNGWQTVRGVKL